MNAKHIILGALVLAAPALALAQAEDEAREEREAPMREALPRADAKLVKELHRIHLEQMALGQLAEEMSSHEKVKMLGQTLMNDHRAADAAIVAMAKEHDLSMPEAMDLHKLTDPLREKKGDAFDRALLTRIVDEHHKAIKLINRHRDDVKPAFRAMLDEQLPVLRQHHHDAMQLLKEVGGPPARARPSRSYRP